MAEFSLQSDNETPLWEPGDVTLTLPGLGKFDVLDRANPIRETEDFNPDNRPVTYIVESLVAQVPEHERKRLRRALVEGIDSGSIQVRTLSDALRWIGEQREEAEEKAVARQTGRPTTGPQHSTP